MVGEGAEVGELGQEQDVVVVLRLLDVGAAPISGSGIFSPYLQQIVDHALALGVEVAEHDTSLSATSLRSVFFLSHSAKRLISAWRATLLVPQRTCAEIAMKSKLPEQNDAM